MGNEICQNSTDNDQRNYILEHINVAISDKEDY